MIPTLGDIVTIEGDAYRVVALSWNEAYQDDPEAGIEAGDMVLSLELHPVSAAASAVLETPEAS